MKKKLTIQTPTEVQSASGYPAVSWADFAANRWAEVNPTSGLERFAAHRIQNENTTIFRMRHVDGITQKMKVVYGGNDYDILSAISDIDQREMILECVLRA